MSKKTFCSLGLVISLLFWLGPWLGIGFVLLNSGVKPENWIACIVAVFGGQIAFAQWLTAYYRLRFDLYNKRLLIFQNSVKVYRLLMLRNFDMAEFNEAHLKFIDAKLESQFLFTPHSGISETLEKINDLIMKLKAIPDLSRNPASFDPISLSTQHSQFIQEFDSRVSELAKKLTPYLSFHSFKFWITQ